MSDTDFVNILTWDKDLYNLLGRDQAFNNYDKTLFKVKAPRDRSAEFFKMWVEKLDRHIQKYDIKWGDEVKNSVLSEEVRLFFSTLDKLMYG